jgi:hypothetical protein
VCASVDWIHLAQDRNQWRAVVNTAMNLRVHKINEFFYKLSDCYLLKKDSAQWRLLQLHYTVICVLCEISDSHGDDYKDDTAVPLHAIQALGGEEV